MRFVNNAVLLSETMSASDKLPGFGRSSDICYQNNAYTYEYTHPIHSLWELDQSTSWSSGVQVSEDILACSITDPPKTNLTQCIVHMMTVCHFQARSHHTVDSKLPTFPKNGP